MSDFKYNLPPNFIPISSFINMSSPVQQATTNWKVIDIDDVAE